MKILLTTLNSKYIHSNLALKYLYESAGIYRDLIDIKEFTINNDDMSVFMEIMMGHYDVICFSCYIWNITRTLGLIRDIRMASPATKIVVGGPEVSFDAESFMKKHDEIDVLISGEGDEVFPKLIENIVSSGGSLERRIIYAEAVSEAAIPFPYTNSMIDKNRIVYYESARGCPFSCSFCLSSVSRGVRLFPMERVKRELEFFLKQRVKQVKFVDRTFNIDEKRSAEMMNFIIQNDNGITNFHFELCGDRISEDMLSAFEKSRNGLFQVEIGVQSVHEEVLTACSRKVDFEMISKNTKRIIAGENVHVHLDLIAGLPYETAEMFKESFNRVYSLEPHDLQLGFLKLLKGTQLRERADEYGYIWRDREPYEIISNNYISSDELLELKRVEHVLELYFNKPGFRNTLRYLLDTTGKKPYDFYLDFSEYYYSKGYSNSSLSRAVLYEILWEYSELSGPEETEGLKELMLYDKISAAAASQFSDKKYADCVHSYIKENFPEYREIAAGRLINQLNYMAFQYNVDDYASGSTGLKKTDKKRLLVFKPGEKNAAGQAKCIRIETDNRIMM